MEKIKAYTFHSNGNDVICKSMFAERINEHILYVTEDEKYGSWSTTYYYLIVEYNGIFVRLDRTNSLEKMTGTTFDYIIKNFEYRADNNLYFNKIDLILCKAVSDKLYEKALISRNHVLMLRKEEDREREEKRKAEAQKRLQEKELEKVRKLKEREEKKKKDELFFKENSDILKSELSSFEKITAKRELTKLYRWDQYATGTTIICSILDLIKKHNYNLLSIRHERYARNGDLLKVPKTHYSLGISKKNSFYRIPAKLGKLLTLKSTE